MVDEMNVYIYPDKPADDNLASDALDALDTATSQTMDYFIKKGEDIGRFISVRKDYPEVVTDTRVGPGPEDPYIQEKSAILRDFRIWRGNNDRVETGVHLLVTDIPNGLGGGLSAGYLGGAWRNGPNAIATKTPRQNTPYFKSLCIHECYHLFINIGLRLGPGLGSDHNLGYVNPNTGKQTPMLNGYWGEGPDTKGNCSNTTNQDPPYSLQLSRCALDSTLYSYRNQGKVFQI